MKKPTGHKRREKTTGEMWAEYRFDYTKAKPNRFAGRTKNGRKADAKYSSGRKRRQDSRSIINAEPQRGKG
ncbi:MAG: hypothetical protein CAF45_007130 [Nitrospira sp. CG24E]|nr:MAG: hypothetical protein CAF45_007130 [Nitrospira sp. CG24E]